MHAPKDWGTWDNSSETAVNLLVDLFAVGAGVPGNRSTAVPGNRSAAAAGQPESTAYVSRALCMWTGELARVTRSQRHNEGEIEDTDAADPYSFADSATRGAVATTAAWVTAPTPMEARRPPGSRQRVQKCSMMHRSRANLYVS